MCRPRRGLRWSAASRLNVEKVRGDAKHTSVPPRYANLEQGRCCVGKRHLAISTFPPHDQPSINPRTRFQAGLKYSSLFPHISRRRACRDQRKTLRRWLLTEEFGRAPIVWKMYLHVHGTTSCSSIVNEAWYLEAWC